MPIASCRRRPEYEGKMKAKETVFVLTKGDRDRIEAAMGLLRQIVRELLAARRTRVNCGTHTPGALHELAEDAEKVREEQLHFNGL